MTTVRRLAAVAALSAAPARDECFILCSASGRFGTGGTYGVHLDYSWLLARRDRVYVGLGVGGKRIVGLRGTADDDFPTLLPSSRVQLGLTF